MTDYCPHGGCPACEPKEEAAVRDKSTYFAMLESQREEFKTQRDEAWRELRELKAAQEQTLERKRAAYEALWNMTRYAGQFQALVRRLTSPTTDAQGIMNALTELRKLGYRDLRWPLEEPYGGEGESKPGAARDPGGRGSGGEGSRGGAAPEDQEADSPGSRGGDSQREARRIVEHSRLRLRTDRPEGGLPGGGVSRGTQGHGARVYHREVRVASEDRRGVANARGDPGAGADLRDRER